MKDSHYENEFNFAKNLTKKEGNTITQSLHDVNISIEGEVFNIGSWNDWQIMSLIEIVEWIDNTEECEENKCVNCGRDISGRDTFLEYEGRKWSMGLCRDCAFTLKPFIHILGKPYTNKEN